MDREFAKTDATFYLIMAIVPAVLLFLGFAPSFYLRGVIPAPVPALSQLSSVHGVVFTACRPAPDDPVEVTGVLGHDHPTVTGRET